MQRKGGRCFPWTSGRRPFFPRISDAARYTLREGGLPLFPTQPAPRSQ